MTRGAGESATKTVNRWGEGPTRYRPLWPESRWERDLGPAPSGPKSRYQGQRRRATAWRKFRAHGNSGPNKFSREDFFSKGENNNSPCSSGSPGFFRCQNTRQGTRQWTRPHRDFPVPRDPPRTRPHRDFPVPRDPPVDPPSPGIFRCQGRTPPSPGIFRCQGRPPPSPEIFRWQRGTPPSPGIFRCQGRTPSLTGKFRWQRGPAPSTEIFRWHRAAPLAAERAGTWQRERERYPFSPPPL